jgi:hypothetical protein
MKSGRESRAEGAHEFVRVRGRGSTTSRAWTSTSPATRVVVFTKVPGRARRRSRSARCQAEAQRRYPNAGPVPPARRGLCEDDARSFAPSKESPQCEPTPEWQRSQHARFGQRRWPVAEAPCAFWT